MSEKISQRERERVGKGTVLAFTALGSLAGLRAPAVAAEKPVTPTTEPSPARFNTIKTSLDARKAAAASKLSPVNSAKLNALVKVIQSEGTSTEWSDGKVFRIVRKGKDGTIYTPEIDYRVAPGNELANTKPDAFTLYIRRPGEKHAVHVVVDGMDSGDMGKLKGNLDGVVDQPLGYDYPNGFDNTYAQAKLNYGTELAGDALNVISLETNGLKAQAEYKKAIDSIRP